MDASRHWRLAAHRLVKSVAPVIVLIAAMLATSLADSSLEPVPENAAGLSGSGWLDEIHRRQRGPLVYLAQRSPGARSSGALTQSKHGRSGMAPRGVKPPYERVLSGVRYPAPVADFLDDLVPAADPGLLDSKALVPAAGGDLHATTPGIPTPVLPLFASGAGVPGGGGNAPVPELTTWFMLVWGMVLVGFGLRTRPVPDREG